MDASTFAALGEVNRLQIVELMRHRPYSVGDIAERLDIRQPQVSKHLRVLREARVVDVQPVARRRIYHLRAEPFEQIGLWVDSFEGRWEARLDSLETFLGSTASDRTSSRKGPR